MVGIRRALLVLLTAALVVSLSAPAYAYEFERPLKLGDTGPDVRALQVRLAGWSPSGQQKVFTVDGAFGEQTKSALESFQSHYGYAPDGVAGVPVYEILAGLEDEDRSTVHFDYSEFWQNRNDACSKKANSFAETFKGGMVPEAIVKQNVRRLMWRLEALRARAGGRPIAINSGFRSIAYNECIGGARFSQHLYGTAVDQRMVDVSNRFERDLAKDSQFQGIGCYSSMSHNHLDLRLENKALDAARFWWWPDRDDEGRDLAEDGRPCWGEKPAAGGGHSSYRSSGELSPGELVLSRNRQAAYEAAGEPVGFEGAD